MNHTKVDLGKVSDAFRARYPELFVKPAQAPSPTAPPSWQRPPKIGKRGATSQRLGLLYGPLKTAVREFRFHPTRRWRFDYAWPDIKLALEVDGGLFVNGCHTRGKARERDYEKDAAAMALGWRVMRVSTDQLKSGEALRWLEAVMAL